MFKVIIHSLKKKQKTASGAIPPGFKSLLLNYLKTLVLSLESLGTWFPHLSPHRNVSSTKEAFLTVLLTAVAPALGTVPDT